nr:GNAT family N-acetyltransferase [Caballeronia sp. BR00000012568055]
MSADDDRNRFDCGVASLNDWLQKTASQHEKKNLTRTYVAVLADKPDAIVGYYALAATSIETEGISAKSRLPRKVAAVLLARLAVDTKRKGKGLGEYLLAHALDTVIVTAETIGIQCVVVDAIDDRAAGFYEKYGFVRLTNDPLRLVLPVATISQA